MSDPGDRIDVGDEQGEAEALDDDVLGGGVVPPDEPYGLPELLGRDTTTAGEEVPDSAEERAAREEPDDLAGADGAELPDGLVFDGSSDLEGSRGEADAEDHLTLSDQMPARAEDPSPEGAAIHVVDDEA